LYMSFIQKKEKRNKVQCLILTQNKDLMYI